MDSILRQRLDNYELLLIDDGSPDNSGAMADEMADNDRIKVYHKANGGPSDARNYGLERATGDYVTFVDSDDEIAQNTFPKLVEILHKHPEYDILEYSVKQIKRIRMYCLTQVSTFIKTLQTGLKQRTATLLDVEQDFQTEIV